MFLNVLFFSLEVTVEHKLLQHHALLMMIRTYLYYFVTVGLPIIYNIGCNTDSDLGKFNR